MGLDSISRLNDYLKDPASPAWSSQGLIDMFNNLDGTMFDKLQIILPIIDERLSMGNTEMTYSQFNFLRDITLHSKYPKTRVDFTPEDLSWLLDKFDQKPTPQRATMIYILLDVKELSLHKKKMIKNLLKGTFAESFIQADD